MGNLFVDMSEKYIQSTNAADEISNFYDTGWITMYSDIFSDPFVPYATSGDQAPKIRRIGKMVMMHGAVKTNAAIIPAGYNATNGDINLTITILSNLSYYGKFTPSRSIYFVNCGSGSGRFCLTISSADSSVSINRYYNYTYKDNTKIIPSGTLLRLDSQWTID